MSSYYHKFGINDVFYNRIKAYPENEFFIWNSQVFYNNMSQLTGAFATNVGGTSVGNLSLYEMNVDRNSTDTGLIYPWIVKNGGKTKFKTMSDRDFRLTTPGSRMISSYGMSASIGREYFPTGLYTEHNAGLGNYTGSALRNTFDSYTTLSPYYAYSSTTHGIDKANDQACLVTIPSIFYGSSIKKGSIDLKMYITGTLIGRLQDTHHNGELIQTEPVGSTGSGSVAGIALYSEGFIYLSGSWSLDTATYTFGTSSAAPKWVYFGTGIDATGSTAVDVSASFNASFKGTNYVPSLTMFAHARKGELNHSNNFSYIKYDQTASLAPSTGSKKYIEQDLTIKNVVSSAYADPAAAFQKTTYISKIGIYDDDKNLIAIASLAKPVKKTEERDFTFKLKLDI